MDDVREFSRKTFMAGALFAGIGVALGAFGAHGLKHHLTVEMTGIFETAVRYQMYHAFGLMVTALAATYFGTQNFKRFRIAGWSFGVGIVLFSGSLYLLSMTSLRWFGAVTPLGGLAFLVGWGALIVALFRKDDTGR